MRVISLKRLREFWELHAGAERPLRNWNKVASKADWRSLTDVRQAYPQADGVRRPDGGILTVFNIKGNRYRLIARVRYDHRLINVRAVLTHEEYDAGDWRD